MEFARRVRGLVPALAAAALLGGLSTLGDWIWASWIPDGAVVPGVVHGVVVFAALAVGLGWAVGESGATRYLLLRLPVAGMAIAALFYPFAWVVGYLPALLTCWVAMWSSLAVLQNRATSRPESAAVVFARALCAAVGSGLAFWVISGIWTVATPASPDYVIRFLKWTGAFLPGFAALQLRIE